MSINELNNGPVGSWSQFIRLKEAARERNSGLTAKESSGAAGAGGTKFSEILSSKNADNVYSRGTVQAYRDSVSAAEIKDLKALGRMFDSYA